MPSSPRWIRGRESATRTPPAQRTPPLMATTSRSGRPVEVELKYRVVEPAAGDRYLTADDLAGFSPSSPVRSTQVEDRYIDTVDGALARAGFAARIRQTAKTTTVGVKSAIRRADAGGAHRREELEGPADRTAPPRDWPPSDARSLILEQCGDAPLVEVVTIRQLRRKRVLERGRTVVEVSLDEVDAVNRSRVVGRFVELEVELVRGDDTELAAINALLVADRGLAPADSSKLESALRAVTAAEPRRTKRGGRLLPPVDVDDIEGGSDGGRRVDDGLDVGRIVRAALGGARANDLIETVSSPPAASSDPEPASTGERPGPFGPQTEERSGAPRADASSSPAPGADAAAGSAGPAAEAAGAEPAGRSARPGKERRSEADGNGRPHLTVGKVPGVLPDDHLAEAGRKVLRFHLARMIAREDGARDGKDVE